MQTLNWYFDFISPYAYLQFKELHRLPENVEVEYTPILFVGLLKHWENVGPAEVDPKRIHTYRYCQWYADKNGIPFTMAEVHPFNPIAVLRLALLNDSDKDTIGAIFDTIWGDGLAPSSVNFWDKLNGRLNGNYGATDPFSDSVKDQLRINTEEAVANKVFGVPTLRAGAENFWGVDSLDMCLDYLDNTDMFTSEKYQRIQNAPWGVPRRV